MLSISQHNKTYWVMSQGGREEILQWLIYVEVETYSRLLKYYHEMFILDNNVIQK